MSFIEYIICTQINLISIFCNRILNTGTNILLSYNKKDATSMKNEHSYAWQMTFNSSYLLHILGKNPIIFARK